VLQRALRASLGVSVGAVFLALLFDAPLAQSEPPPATIRVSSAPSGSSLSGELVQGVMTLRGDDYIVALRGVATPVSSVGTAHDIVRPRDVEGVYARRAGGERSTDDELRSASGVRLRFDPPLELPEGRLEVEVLSRRIPKVSSGHRESGVD
jgi:hypothetical protein